jgi:energy-coupling factor transporter ATP-binding protein EcfA2
MNNPKLQPHHLKDLASSGLSMLAILKSGAFSIGRRDATVILGFDPGCGGLAFPYPSANGKPPFVRIKPDTPFRGKDGKDARYLTPKGASNRLYLSHTLDPAVLLDASVPLIITEGEKKAIKSIAEGFPCVGLAGVWSWKTRGEENESRPIQDLNLIEWKGRTVFLIFDSDAATNRKVRQAERELAAHLKGRGADVRIVRLPSEPDGSKNGLDDFLVRHGKEALRSLMDRRAEAEGKREAEGDEEDDEKPKRPSQADRLVKVVLLDAELFHDQTQTPYARVNVGGRFEILRCQGRGFRRWISRRFYEAEEKAPGGEAVASALNVIEAKAVFDGDRRELHNRVAFHDGAIWCDLTDERWRAVRVTPGGWQVIDNPPILFVRYEHHAPQVEPIKGGDVHRLFDFVAVNGDGPRLLLMIYLVSCFIPDIPHPVPILHGPQGSGKSTVFRVLRRLIDPSVIEVLSFSRDEKELVQLLAHHWCCFFDNMETLQGWQSDMLCRAVTGEGFSKRVLFSDDDDLIYSFRRCCGLNGINVAATRADLLDRSILIALDRIPPNRRRPETALWTAFEEARPHILGGIFDALAEAMRVLPEVRLSTLPRMADFARWGCAIAQALGYTAGDFRQAYGENIEAQNEEVLQGHPVAAAVLAMMEDLEAWEGAPSELLARLVEVAETEKIDTRARLWPKAAHILTRRLNEVRPNLQEAGVLIEHSHGKGNLVTLKRGDNSVGSVEASNRLQDKGMCADATPTLLTPLKVASKVASPNNLSKNKDADATDATDATFATPTGDDLREVRI